MNISKQLKLLKSLHHCFVVFKSKQKKLDRQSFALTTMSKCCTGWRKHTESNDQISIGCLGQADGRMAKSRPTSPPTAAQRLTAPCRWVSSLHDPNHKAFITQPVNLLMISHTQRLISAPRSTVSSALPLRCHYCGRTHIQTHTQTHTNFA